jgi:hypothetical protein
MGRAIKAAGWAIVALMTALPGSALASRSARPASSAAVWTFVSAPQLHPPKLSVRLRKPGLARGYFLTAEPPGRGAQAGAQGGDWIMDSQGRPVWFLPANSPFYLQQDSYRGKPVLVVFSAVAGGGSVLIYNEHYHRIAMLRARSPWSTDPHDASITGDDIWITVARDVNHQNLTQYGGPRNADVQDVGLQEFQISSGHLLRTWDALNPGGRSNVPLSDSEEPASRSWDAYHLNSVQALPSGDLLLSMRNTWSVYLIDPARHQILWRLGGRASTFPLPGKAQFAWQHDARLIHPGDGGHGRRVELSLFDNNSRRGQAKGLIFRLNTTTNRVVLLDSYQHHPPYRAEFMGSMQVLPNGNALVDWGLPHGDFTEFSSTGNELLDAAWPFRGQTYRTVFSDNWVGRPSYPPRGAARGPTVYASWNGATRVARWEVMAGTRSGSLRVVAKHARTGFETAIKLSRSYPSYRVRALDSEGKLLGTSKPFS